MSDNVVPLSQTKPRAFFLRYRGHRIYVKFDLKAGKFSWEFVHGTTIVLKGRNKTAKEAEKAAKKQVDELIDKPEG